MKLIQGKRLLFSLITSFLLVFTAFSQPKLTRSSEISLLTCGPGTEIYSLFGHTAIRVKDDSLGLDLVFNYGLFSFNTDNFIYKFTKGETYYRLGIQRFGGFMREYKEEGRAVYEQVLNLNLSEREDLFERLNINYLPENRVYLYRFFLDNCATRPRDIVQSTLSSRLEWKSVSNMYVSLPAEHWKTETIKDYNEKWGSITYRNIISIYFDDSPWSGWGIDFGLGQPTDTLASQYSAMFAPDFLMNSLENATIEREGKTEALVKEERLLLKNEETTQGSFSFFTPFSTFLLLFLFTLFLSYIEFKKGKFFIVYDIILLFITGIMGLLIVYISFFSIHDFVASNYDILWANPFNFIVALLLIFRKIRKFVMRYNYFTFVVLLLTLLFWSLIPEDLNENNLLIIASLLVRSTMGIRYISGKTVGTNLSENIG